MWVGRLHSAVKDFVFPFLQEEMWKFYENKYSFSTREGINYNKLSHGNKVTCNWNSLSRCTCCTAPVHNYYNYYYCYYFFFPLVKNLTCRLGGWQGAVNSRLVCLFVCSRRGGLRALSDCQLSHCRFKSPNKRDWTNSGYSSESRPFQRHTKKNEDTYEEGKEKRQCLYVLGFCIRKEKYSAADW